MMSKITRMATMMPGIANERASMSPPAVRWGRLNRPRHTPSSAGDASERSRVPNSLCAPGGWSQGTRADRRGRHAVTIVPSAGGPTGAQRLALIGGNCAMANRSDRPDFGPNEWLIDEMYRRFRDDPESVSEAWREFLEDYRPGSEPERPKFSEQASAPNDQASPPANEEQPT